MNSPAGADEVLNPSTPTCRLQSDSESLETLALYDVRVKNALTSTYKLPPETLGEIFAWLSEMDPGCQVTVSMVCSRWREVGTFSRSYHELILNHLQIALKHSSLWTEIDCSKMSWQAAETILARSRSLPLRITADFGMRLQNTLVWADHLDRAYPRIECLVMDAIPANQLREALGALKPMPLLTEISLDVQHWLDDINPLEPLPAGIEDCLVASHGLTRVSLKGCLPAILPSRILPTSLTHLTLATELDNPALTLSSVDKLVELISGLGKLCELHLQGLPEHLIPATGTSSICTLPHCFRLLRYDPTRMNGSFDCSRDFLSRLKLPTSVGAEIIMNVEMDNLMTRREQQTEFAQIALAALNTFGPHNTPRTLDLDDGSVQMDLHDAQSASSTPSSIYIQRVGYYKPFERAGATAELLKRLPLDNISSIVFDPEDEEYCFSGEHSCIDQLLEARQVLDLTIGLPIGSTHPHLIRALRHPYSHKGSDSVLFPHLQSITLLGDGDDAEQKPERALTALGFSCAWRASHGCPLKKLRVDLGEGRVLERTDLYQWDYSMESVSLL